MATFVVAHGAWSAGWAWKKMHALMQAARHRLLTPTYTGLGERSHLANPQVDLETHIADVLGVLECEELRGVILIGHSYGGMVATGVADRARDAVAQLVYLDAFAPQSGQSAFDMMPAERAEAMRDRARRDGEGWRIPPNPLPEDTTAEDVAWAAPKRVPQPLQAFERKLELRNGPLTLPRHYIYCRRFGPGDGFRPSYERAKREGWSTFEIDASHNPHIIVPEALMAVLEEVSSSAPNQVRARALA